MFHVAALYKFTPFDDPVALKARLVDVAAAHGVKGTLLLAPEGINGTIAATRTGIDAIIDAIRALPGCGDLEWKESTAAEMPFRKMKVRIKREIVSMGQPQVDPTSSTGSHVEPGDWNALILQEDVAVIDTRNDYEVEIGTFKGADDPETASFGEFPDWWKRNHNRYAGKKIAMFCTGGIRCEKSTNLLIEQGFSEVYHLKGGILKYLEEVAEEESLWQGECFVFDARVSVGHGLVEGDYDLCHACRRPLAQAGKASPDYEPGVSCARCIGEVTDADRARFRERQHQIDLARSRGTRHMGDA